MKIAISNLKDILSQMGINPDKNYGQNFLIDENIAQKIASLVQLQTGEKCLEVGPGLGSLTHFLIANPIDLDVVDIDENMCAMLNVIYRNQKINIINDDIRNIDISTYDKIVSNLPYNLTSELILYFLKNATRAKKMVLMCQSETLRHFLDTSGKEYGPTSVLLHLLGEVKKEFDVPNSCFYPAPKCKSSVFTIDLYSNINRETIIPVYKMAKTLFKGRRKTISNNLKNYINNDTIIDAVLNDVEIDPKTRPEQISPRQYSKLYERLLIISSHETPIN